MQCTAQRQQKAANTSLLESRNLLQTATLVFPRPIVCSRLSNNINILAKKIFRPQTGGHGPRPPGSATGWWATPLPSEICPQSDPPPRKTPTSTGFPMSYRWSAYVTPKSTKSGSKKQFFCFLINVNFNRIKSATKFLCVKTSSGKIVVRPFHCLTIHKC